VLFVTGEELLDVLRGLPQRPIIPNQAQMAVMEYNEGPLWVIAGPGTGKTLSLVLRCVRLLCVDRIPPEAIFLTTFTRKAARQLEHRLHELLGQLAQVVPEVGQIDLSRLRLGTLHRLCWDLLTETPASSFRHLKLLDELDRAFFIRTYSRICSNQPDIEPLLRSLLAWVENPDAPHPRDVLPSRWDRVKTFLTAYQRLLDDRIDRERLAMQNSRLDLLVQLAKEYEAALAEKKFTDYSLVQQQTLTMLQSTAGKEVVEGTATHPGIQHVIVDEYQDTNPLQAAIYRALAHQSPHHLCVVGDDDQALYRFRGGTVTCMVGFADECRQEWPESRVHQISLTETYRSHPTIVTWVNAFVQAHPEMGKPHARVLSKLPLRATRPPTPPGPTIWAIRGKNAEEVANTFAEVLAQLLAQGVLSSPAQCALLAHSVKASARGIGPYLTALEQQQIPTSLAVAPKEHPLFRQVLGTVLAALDPGASLRPATFAAQDRPLANFVEACEQAALRNVARKMHVWLITDPEAAREMTLSQLAWYVLNTQECDLQMKADPEATSASQALLRMFDAYGRIVQHGWRGIPLEGETHRQVKATWMRFCYEVLIEAMHKQRPETEEVEEGHSLQSAAVPVMTIHSSKGLEFPAVAVVVDKRPKAYSDETHRLERAFFPYRKPPLPAADPIVALGGDDEARGVQDSIRLHYVAYSRARDLLFLLIPDTQWEPSPAVGLGPTKAWFQQHIPDVWPPQPGKRPKGGHAGPAKGVQGVLF
jgi:DNA helicase-2/ATP-dependent DNA helicase PcrA